MKKALSLILKISVSVLLLWLVLSRTDLTAITNALRAVNLFWIIVACILLFLGKILTSYRWQRLLAAYGIHIPLGTLIASLYVGQFFNSFLPSTIGGDAIRAYDTARYSQEKTKALTAVFLDRLIGMTALAILGGVALIAGLWLRVDIASFLWLILATVAACCLALVVVFNRPLAARVDTLLKRLGLAKIARKINMASDAFLELREQKGTLWAAFWLSIALQVNVVLFYYTISLALNLQVGLIYYFLIIPVVLVILLIPFSINGIGLREGAYVFFLTPLGAPAAGAIALSWIAFGLTLMTVSIVGGVIFALRGVNWRQFQLELQKR